MPPKPPRAKKGPPSPGKKKTFQLPKGGERGFEKRIRVYRFCPPLEMEVYISEKNSSTDAYLKGLSDYINPVTKNEFKHETIDNCNFTEILNRRISCGRDENMFGTGKDATYPRKIIVRYPEEGFSTEETRQKGLNALKTFFEDSRFHKFPHQNIILEDMNNDKVSYYALDEFFKDKNIENIMNVHFESDELNKNFFKKYSKFANYVYKGKEYGNYAMSLGFRTEE